MKDKLRELAAECRKPYPEGAHGTRYADGYNDAGNDIADRLDSILDAEGDGGAVEVCIPFGEGKVVVTTGTHGGMPCVFLAPASIPGVVGESAARENLPSDRRIAGESILTFPTAEQASLVANTLCGKNTHPARSGVVSDEDAREAARYRWLRGQMFVKRNAAVPDRYGLDGLLLAEGIDELDDFRYIDQAIDAAMQGESHVRG